MWGFHSSECVCVCVCEHSRLSGQDTSIGKYLRIGAAYCRHRQGCHSAWCHIQQVLNLSWHMKQYFFIHFPWQSHVYSKLLGWKAKGKNLWSVTVLSRVAQLHAAINDCPRHEDICEFPVKLLVSWYVRTCMLVYGYRCLEVASSSASRITSLETCAILGYYAA